MECDGGAGKMTSRFPLFFIPDSSARANIIEAQIFPVGVSFRFTTARAVALLLHLEGRRIVVMGGGRVQGQGTPGRVRTQFWNAGSG